MGRASGQRGNRTGSSGCRRAPSRGTRSAETREGCPRNRRAQRAPHSPRSAMRSLPKGHLRNCRSNNPPPTHPRSRACRAGQTHSERMIPPTPCERPNGLRLPQKTQWARLFPDDVPPAVLRLRACPRRILPLRLCGQAVRVSRNPRQPSNK